MANGPFDYSEQIAHDVCEHIAKGGSLVSYCKREDTPSYTSIMKWMGMYPDFAEKYARAREAQADVLAEEIIDIADSKRDDPQRSRLMMDARKWYAGKLRPKKYGDSMNIGGQEDNPVKAEMSLTVSFKKPDGD